MGIKASLVAPVVQLMIERPSRKHTLREWALALERSGKQIEAHVAVAADPGKAAATLRHVIGIESWSQSRLRVFLGAPLQMDEYDAYAPGADLDLATLRAVFAATRDATINLAGQLAEADVSETATVTHNTFGPLSARGWLAYLDGHATREVSRIK